MKESEVVGTCSEWLVKVHAVIQTCADETTVGRQHAMRQQKGAYERVVRAVCCHYLMRARIVRKRPNSFHPCQLRGVFLLWVQDICANQ